MTKPAPQQPTPEREVYNAGDEQHVARAKGEARERDKSRVDGLKKMVADPDMRAYLYDLLAFCGISRTSFTGNSTTFFNEGQRNVGLRIQADLLAHCPDAYVVMLKEAP